MSQREFAVGQQKYGSKQRLSGTKCVLTSQIHSPTISLLGSFLRPLNRFYKRKNNINNEISGQLESERRELYREYLQLKQKSAEIDNASQTIEEYLESQRGEPDKNRKKGELE